MKRREVGELEDEREDVENWRSGRKEGNIAFQRSRERDRRVGGVSGDRHRRSQTDEMRQRTDGGIVESGPEQS